MVKQSHAGSDNDGYLWLLSIVITAVMITWNHLYVLGTDALVLGAVLAFVPAALFWWFRRRASKVAWAGYVLMSLWIIVGFGLMKGFWNGVLRIFVGTFL